MGTDVEPDDVLDAMHELPDPVFSAPEIAEQIGCTPKTVSNKLETLEYAGKVERKDVGARAVAWWLSGTRKPRADAERRERRLKPDQSALDEVAVSSGGGPDRPQDAAESIRRRAEQDIADMDLPGSGETLEARRQTLLDLWEHLRVEGESQKSEFLKVIEANEHGYETPESFWSNVVKGSDTLQSLPGVQSPGEGEHKWRWWDV